MKTIIGTSIVLLFFAATVGAADKPYVVKLEKTFEELIVQAGAEYRNDQIKSYSHCLKNFYVLKQFANQLKDWGYANWQDYAYAHAADKRKRANRIKANGELKHSRSRVYGDVPGQVQAAYCAMFIDYARSRGLNDVTIAYCLAVTRVESGFNPDAASGFGTDHGYDQHISRQRKELERLYDLPDCASGYEIGYQMALACAQADYVTKAVERRYGAWGLEVSNWHLRYAAHNRGAYCKTVNQLMPGISLATESHRNITTLMSTALSCIKKYDELKREGA